MAFSRNQQRLSKASAQCLPKKPPTSASRNTPVISTIRHLPDNERDWSESMRVLLRELLHQENRSMEDMLNSSINHFTQYLAGHDDVEVQNHQLLRQNQRLTAAIEELKAILRQKLEAALRKQREDLNVMMQDYIQLIQKLLRDKEEFAAKLEEEAQRADLAQELVNAIAEEQLNHQAALEQKGKLIEALTAKESQQNSAIEDGRAKIETLLKQNEELKARLASAESKPSHPPDLSQDRRDDANASKCKFLLQLLEQSEAEVKKLRERLRQEAESPARNAVIEELRQRIAEMEVEHEEEFKEYDQSMREALERKDHLIDGLTRTIDGMRRQKAAP